jgi:hypothetical protein
VAPAHNSPACLSSQEGDVRSRLDARHRGHQIIGPALERAAALVEIDCSRRSGKVH